MPNWDDILEKPAPCGHFVQLYFDERYLAHSVGRYLASGLKRGDRQLVIASQDHSEAFCREIADLGVDAVGALNDGRMLILDPCRTLERFMVNGRPDWTRFRKTITDAIHRLRSAQPGAALGAYGEMVGVLWTAGEYSAAIQLEALWNDLLQSFEFSLFCSYPIDVFDEQFQITGVDAILRDHTHLLPSCDERRLKQAIDLAMGEFYDGKSSEFRPVLDARYRQPWGILPQAEDAILWIRKNLPGNGAHILRRARNHYMASQLSS